MQGETLVVEGLSHEELAERLGVYRETVSAALRELKDAGIITSGRKHITISQPARLREIASL
jgi:CRP-like cAMP-binding protein